jgi:hypothetical protein
MPIPYWFHLNIFGMKARGQMPRTGKMKCLSTMLKQNVLGVTDNKIFGPADHMLKKWVKQSVLAYI